jgi:hypothetical protein
VRRGNLRPSALAAVNSALLAKAAAAELTHCLDACSRDLRGEALPLETIWRFDSPRRHPRPWLRCSSASKASNAAPDLALGGQWL